MSFLKKLDRFEEGVLLVLFPAMVIVVFVATVARYLNLFPMFWGEELARYIMVYLAYTGAGLAMKTGSHISISFLVDRIANRKIRMVFDVMRLLVLLFFTFSIVLMMLNIIQRLIAMNQTSPAMFIPIWTMYAAVPYGMILVSIRAMQGFVIAQRALRDEIRKGEG
ncbi:MAG: TRAP transporter small permease [Spirochaeta sp.]|jgi:TRAP-type C4-dicarboxylate transport system permease small subunit|nr:TRAP transporter small permease [Spirochaeta sp.]